MMINAMMPYAFLGKTITMTFLKKFWDRKFKMGDIYATRKNSMQQYKNVYEGSDYLVHFKYSGILNIVYISMMYGIGMPLLFPIGALNFFN